MNIKRKDWKKTMKIVFLDVKTIGEDIDLTGFDRLGEVVRYPYSSPEQVPERVTDADVLIVNKVPVNEKTIYTAKNLKLVCVAATGTNNLDKDYLASRNIEWRNVAGYSTESVAQHTFAMAFYLLEKLRYYDEYTGSGKYVNDILFTHFDRRFHELATMRWGVIGLGNIGRRVADIAKMFGAEVVYYSTSGAAPQEGYQQVDLDTLVRTCDVISVHAPLNENTEGLINAELFDKMKKDAIFLNLGRGPIVVEKDLADAIKERKIGGAALDVLCKEPMAEDNPLVELLGDDHLLITPHIAWATVEARIRLMKTIEGQIKEFFA